MQKPRNYKTKQRETILSALQRAPGGHVTAELLAEQLRAGGAEVGLATVYRNLDKLVCEGMVLKYSLPGGQRACYQYLGEAGEENHHSHLICTECGGVTHLSCGAVDEFAAHLGAEHGFALDRQRTVLYGHCAACASHTTHNTGETV